MYLNDVNLLANSLGILSLIGSSCILFPAIVYKQKNEKNHKNNLSIVRYALVITIFLGLVHGLLMTQKEDIDFYNLNTYWVYAEGLLTFNLLIFMALVFDEFKNNFKKLIYLSYAALFLLGCHVWQQVAHLFI